MKENSAAQSQVYLNYQKFVDLHKDYQKKKFQNINHNLMLLIAKSYFLAQKYDKCKSLLLQLPKNSTSKILYERQTLLFKASYLMSPNNISELENILKEYSHSQFVCTGKPLTKFHNDSLTEMMEAVNLGISCAKKIKEVDKKKLKDQLKESQKKRKYDGFPIYLISKKWSNKFEQYFTNQQLFPGPVTNFQLINHIFEFQPHTNREPSRDYMNKLLFPCNQGKDYNQVSSKYWEIVEKIFGGYPVKRVYVFRRYNIQNKCQDNLTKAQILRKNQKFVMQWQLGSYYDKAVMPMLTQLYGQGQLKYQTRNKDFEVISSRKIQELSSTLKYVEVDVHSIKAFNEKEELRKRQLVNKYDMQKYNLAECKNQHTVGLINLGNSCYMNSGLQLLSNLTQLSNFFITNDYLRSVNISDLNVDGSFGETACAFGDLVKRLWFSSNQTRYIDPYTFRKAFAKKYQHFQGPSQEDSQQFLIFLLNCLHQDLNQKAKGGMSTQKKVSSINKQFEQSRDSTINLYKQGNNSKISELFNGFHFQQIMCGTCKQKTYKFQDHLMIHLQVPSGAPTLNISTILSKNPTDIILLAVYIKKLKKISQVLKLVSEHFSCQHELFPLLRSGSGSFQPLENDTEISYVEKKTKKGEVFLICEVAKPQSDDEQIAAILYLQQSKQRRVCGISYPRFLAIKKCFKQQKNRKNLNEVVLSAATKTQFLRKKQEHIKHIGYDKVSKKFYKVQYTVYSQQNLTTFSRVPTNKILGQNQREEEITIQNLFEKMSKQQIIDIKEGWKCEKCQQVRAAEMVNKIYSVGHYVIIQLKRFTENGKITTKILYPINNLNMRSFIFQSQSSDNFILQAVILHRGQMSSGHYICLCRSKNNRWIRFDDQNVFEQQQQIVPDQNAYILVYEKSINQNQNSILSNQNQGKK